MTIDALETNRLKAAVEKTGGLNPRWIYLLAAFPVLITLPHILLSDRYLSGWRIGYVLLCSAFALCLLYLVLSPRMGSWRKLFESYAVWIFGFVSLAYALLVAYLQVGLRLDRGLGLTVDLGLIEQTLWAGSQGRFFHSTFYGSFLAAHFAPILVPLSLLFRAIPDIRAVFVLQTLLFVLAGIALFALLKKEGGNTPALLVSLSFLVSPAVMGQHWTIYLNHFAPFFWIAASLAFWKKNLAGFVVSSIFAALVQEDIAFSLLIFALLAWRWKMPREWKLFTLIFPLVWFAAAMLTMQAQGGGSGVAGGGHFGDLGGTPAQIAQNLALDPLVIFSKIVKDVSSKVVWVYDLLGPFLLVLPLASPMALAALPDFLAFSFIQLPVEQYSINWYFSLFVTTVLFTALAYSLNRFSAFAVPIDFKSKGLNIVGVLILCTNLSILPRVLGPQMFTSDASQRLATLRKMEAMIPPDACIAATSDISEAFAKRFEWRRLLYSTTRAPANCQYLVVSQQYVESGPGETELKGLVQQLEAGEGYNLVMAENRVELFIRR